MKYLVFLCLLFVGKSLAQTDRRNLLGIYAPDKNIERLSKLELATDYRFIYKYGIGSCQGEVRGVWGRVQEKIKLKNDPEFLNHATVTFPDLSLVDWSIKKNGIKPDGPFYACGFIEKRLHRKSKTN